MLCWPSHALGVGWSPPNGVSFSNMHQGATRARGGPVPSPPSAAQPDEIHSLSIPIALRQDCSSLSPGAISAAHYPPFSVFHPAASVIFWQRKSECIPLLLGAPPDLAVPTRAGPSLLCSAGGSALPGLSPSAWVPARGLLHALPAAASSQHWPGHGGGGGGLHTFPDWYDLFARSWSHSW